MAASAKQLKQRWKDRPDLADAASAWLGDTARPLPTGIEFVEGRIDLRGLPTFPAGLIREINGTHWDQVDLSHADLSGLQLSDVRITGSRLDSTNMKRVVFAGGECVRTSLVGADLQDASFGGLRPGTGTTWSEVDFTKAKMAKRFIVGAQISNCTFRDTKMKATEFYRCLISDTVFATDLREVIFEGRRMGMAKERPFPEYESVPMRGVDFTGSTFYYTTFRQCATEAVTWPEDPKLRIVPVDSPQVEKAIAWLVAQGGGANKGAAKTLHDDVEDANVALPEGTRYLLVNLAEWERPPLDADVEAALFGAGQRS